MLASWCSSSYIYLYSDCEDIMGGSAPRQSIFMVLNVLYSPATKGQCMCQLHKHFKLIIYAQIIKRNAMDCFTIPAMRLKTEFRLQIAS